MPGDKSRENGKKGGRPKGHKREEVLAYRELLLKRVEEERGAIIDALIAEAKAGNIKAIQEVNERHLGKVIAPVDVTSGGKPIPILNPLNVSINHSNQENKPAQETD